MCARNGTGAAEELELCRPNDACPKRQSIVDLSLVLPRAMAAAGVQMVATRCLLMLMMELDDNVGRLRASFASQFSFLD